VALIIRVFVFAFSFLEKFLLLRLLLLLFLPFVRPPFSAWLSFALPLHPARDVLHRRSRPVHPLRVTLTNSPPNQTIASIPAFGFSSI
jgi:hypothetical protein